MGRKNLSGEVTLYDDKCPMLSAAEIFASKWKLPILWYISESENTTIRYCELKRRVKGITATMLTKCLKELERDDIVIRKQYNTIPPTVEYSLTDDGKNLIPFLNALSQWEIGRKKRTPQIAESVMKAAVNVT